MDSARPEVLDFYRQRGAEVIDLHEDQDSTDLHKCLAHIERRFSREQLARLDILVLGVQRFRTCIVCIYVLPAAAIASAVQAWRNMLCVRRHEILLCWLFCEPIDATPAGAMGGRIDHTLSNINTLLSHAHLRLVLLGDASTARLLPAGASSIRPALVSPSADLTVPLCAVVDQAGRCQHRGTC